MVQGVIFDMDGLMFDTERLSMELWGAQLAAQGFAFTPAMGKAIRGRNDEGIRAVLGQQLGPTLDYDKARNGVRAEMLRRLDQEGMPVKPGLNPLLAWLKAQGVPCAVASSSSRASVEHHCRAAGVWAGFSAVVCGDMVTHSKPHPEIFLRAAQALGVPPQQCLVLEDSFNGVRAGHAGGFITVMVPDMDQPTPEIDALYTAKASSLEQVLGWLRAGQL